MTHAERLTSLSVLQLLVDVYVAAGVVSHGEALRIGMVLKDSQARAQRDQASALSPAQRPALALVDGP